MVIVAQLVRAPDCGSGGRGFETHLSPKGKAVKRMLHGFFLYPKPPMFASKGFGVQKKPDRDSDQSFTLDDHVPKRVVRQHPFRVLANPRHGSRISPDARKLWILTN
jgi:hypothetical protein